MGFLMSDVILKIVVALSMKLLTEKFLAGLIVHSLEALVEKTSNSLDDKIIRDLKEALDVKD